MTEKETNELAGRMSGRWQGDEEIVMGPAQPPLQSVGRFSNTAVLGGRGIRADYVQETGGEAGMVCETVYRFDADGAVVMSWFPGEGEPQVYRGTVTDFRIEVSRTNADGMLETLTADYSEPGRMSNSMQLKLPDGTDMTVFSGDYRRLPPPPGKAVWRDLTVADAVSLKGFYEDVLGWKAEGADMGGYEDFHMLDADGEVAAGVCHARGGNADLPPVWLPYFAVGSADDAIARAKAGGGRVVAGPKGYDAYRYVVIEDPAGASFVACEEVQP